MFAKIKAFMTKEIAVSGLSQRTNVCKGFPEKEIQVWLKNRPEWNHEDWLNLIEILRKKGYGSYVDSEEKRAKIGVFLEKNRCK